MDFVAKEIFYLFWFSLALGTFGAITKPTPVNQAVLDGATDVQITCVSTTNANAIKWSFMPAGSKDNKPINIVFTDNADYSGLAGADGKSYTLTIKKASSSTAGKYTCDEGGKYSALLIVLEGEASCDYSPRETKTLPCESTLTLSSTVSYIADTTVVSASFEWSTDPPTEGLVSPPSTSGNIVTSMSTLNVNWPKDGNMPIYNCTIKFTLEESAIKIDKLMAKFPPVYMPSCLPFTSPDSVPCGGKDGGGGKGDKKGTTDKADKSEENSSSVRSAETNNLAIRVLGVAGVLLLAQVL